MRDITGKPDTRRRARALARLTMPADCARRIADGTLDKGDAREAARIAAYMAAKRTSDLLPHCHPLPLHHCQVDFELGDSYIDIAVEVATVGPTGVEMEALTAASVAALTLYDMLKPHAGRELEITAVRLDDKRGGKTDYARALSEPMPALLLTCSSSVLSGAKSDDAADMLCSALKGAGFSPIQRQILGDDPQAIAAAVQAAIDDGVGLVATVGGTGVNPGDLTVEALEPLIEQSIPGLMEAARAFGQRRTPYALMSRGVAGRSQRTLIVSFPGSQAGVRETWQAISSGLIHAVEVIRRTRP